MSQLCDSILAQAYRGTGEILLEAAVDPSHFPTWNVTGAKKLVADALVKKEPELGFATICLVHLIDNDPRIVKHSHSNYQIIIHHNFRGGLMPHQLTFKMITAKIMNLPEIIVVLVPVVLLQNSNIPEIPITRIMVPMDRFSNLTLIMVDHDEL